MLEKEKKMESHTMYGIKKDYKVMNIGRLKIKNSLECHNYQMISKHLTLLNKDQNKSNLAKDAKELKNVDGLPFVQLYD